MRIMTKAGLAMLAVSAMVSLRGPEAKAQDGARIAAGVLQGIANGLNGHGGYYGHGGHGWYGHGHVYRPW